MYRIFFVALIACISHGQAYGQVVKGQVTSLSNGEPLIGVSILAVPTGTGTISDFDGNFSIDITKANSLEISYIGYKKTIIPINPSTSYLIRLADDSEIIDEVVIVGYGVIKKSDLTGAVTKIKSEELTKIPSTNVMQSLQGKVAGLQISSASGDPGANPIVRLRGITTLNDNNPIAVIDGVITDISTVNMLNPSDIESIEVLRDASASAIYGSRGAAGVIIITTKKGSEGAHNVSVAVETSIEQIANRIDVMNGREFATYINQIQPGTYNNLDVLPNTDWQSMVYKDFAPIMNANLSVGGGNKKANYYLGLGYFNQEGIIPKSGLQRLTTKLNSGYQLSSRIKVGMDISVLLSDKDNTPGVVNTALRAWPIDSPYKEDGVTFAEVNGGNPIAAIEYTNSKTRRFQGFGNLYANVNIINGLNLRSSVQFDLSNGRTRSFTPKYFVGPLQQNDLSALSFGFNESVSMIYENTLDYTKTFGLHSISSVVGHTAQDSRGEFIVGKTEGLLREDPLFWYLDTGITDLNRVNNNGFRNTLLSYLGRVVYSYDSRYLLTASFRRDGSSKFGPNNKYGNFPSIAVGWNVSNEKNINLPDAINRLKARASYGIIGNEKINGNAQYALISSGYNAVLGINEDLLPGATFNGGGNPNLKWEETTQFNVGVDVGLWNDKLTAEVDYYVKNTSDILVPLQPIGYTGIGSFRSIFYNAADVQNKGLEWSVNYRNNYNQWRYKVGVIGTTIKNVVTDIGQGLGADSLLVGGDLGNGQQIARTAVGRPIGYFFGYQVEGVFQNQNELESLPALFGQTVGDLRYKDVNKDGRITSADRTVIGSAIPDVIYGFSAEIGRGAFTLSADFQGQIGGDIYNGKQAVRFATLNYESKFVNAWNGEGSTNEHFKASQGGNNFLPSSYFVEDGSFLRLRTLTLNYSMSSKLCNKMKLTNANIYIRGVNLFTITKFTGYSPEIGAGNATDGVIDRGIYPITRVMTVGFNTNF